MISGRSGNFLRLKVRLLVTGGHRALQALCLRFGLQETKVLRGLLATGSSLRSPPGSLVRSRGLVRPNLSLNLGPKVFAHFEIISFLRALSGCSRFSAYEEELQGNSQKAPRDSNQELSQISVRTPPVSLSSKSSQVDSRS